MKCLIVAAGQGVRLKEKGDLKPLVPIKGIPIIEHVIRRAHSAGVDEFFVVGGYRRDDLTRELDAIAESQELRITVLLT